mgnify:CR=1 FL=1
MNRAGDRLRARQKEIVRTQRLSSALHPHEFRVGCVFCGNVRFLGFGQMGRGGDCHESVELNMGTQTETRLEMLMNRLLRLVGGNEVGLGVEVVLEFMGLRPPYRLGLAAGEPLASGDPRREVFEAQLTYILNTGGMMFVFCALPLKSVRTGTSGESIALDSCAVYAVRFQGGHWFPVPADQIDALFERPPERDLVLWLFRDFPRE